MEDKVVLEKPLMDGEKVDLEQAPTHIDTRFQAGEKVNDFEVDIDFLAKVMSRDKLIVAQRYHSRNTETGYGDKIVNVNVKVGRTRKPEKVNGENPGQCTILTHDIELLPGTAPIRQHPYRISPAKKLVMKEEVEYLLRAGLAKPSKSPWVSPCLLVPKEDGSMCRLQESKFCYC
ncbi:uncharacterized protein LOC135215365 [Macrobrachium nipponense]|uniref:uncharacterized protein LOC135215365 n=1 Tax=Macrobrachium nipponense TaxID=159736 RepID=UPI0030C7A624